MMSRRVVIVTGAGGFVGANLVRRLVVTGHEVHAVLPPHSDPWRLLDIADLVHVKRVDLTDERSVRLTVAEIDAQWAFHLAAHGAYSWQTDFDRITDVNVRGTANLVRACIDSGVERIVCAGSSSEYGFKDHAPSETEVIEPNSDYAVAKASATLIAQLLSRRSGTPVSTLRLYSVYGPFEDPARLIPSVVRAGLAGELPPLANPATARDFVHVDDVVEAFLLVAQQVDELGMIFNVGTGDQVDLRTVAALATEYFGIKTEPRWGSLDGREWDTDCWVSDSSRLRHLGWRPRFSFADGFARTARWWLEHPVLLDVASSSATVPAQVDLAMRSGANGSAG